tara:strand:- start:398 stop:598 length:201 start_codon:yes stop_codon:yes gene_type:complete
MLATRFWTYVRTQSCHNDCDFDSPECATTTLTAPAVTATTAVIATTTLTFAFAAASAASGFLGQPL